MISVIIPVYNVEKFLSRCLDSVLNQTCQNFEIICVNDGSTDSSAEILNDYALKDSRIKIITQKNSGLSMARNAGLKEANGNYIQFLDSDDALHPQALNIAIKLAKENNAEVVNFKYERSNGVDYNPKPINEDKIKFKVTNDPVFLGCKGKNRLSFNAWSKLYKKEILKDLEFIPKIYFEDYPHTYAVLSRKPKTVSISEELIFYTYNANSISNQRKTVKHIDDYHTGINFIYEIYKKTELKKELNFIIKTLIPTVLKQQLKMCEKAPEGIKEDMYTRFAEELKDLNSKGLIVWRFHKISRYLKYKKLMKKGSI